MQQTGYTRSTFIEYSRQRTLIRLYCRMCCHVSLLENKLLVSTRLSSAVCMMLDTSSACSNRNICIRLYSKLLSLFTVIVDSVVSLFINQYDALHETLFKLAVYILGARTVAARWKRRLQNALKRLAVGDLTMRS